MRTRTLQQEQTPHQPPGEVYAELGFVRRRPTVEGVLASYVLLPKVGTLGEMTPQHRLHHVAVGHVLGEALFSYNDAISNELSASRISRFRLGMITDEFSQAKASARSVNFIPEVIQPMSQEFIDLALNFDKYRPDHLHTASIEMGLAIGSNKVLDEKLRRVEQHAFNAINAVHKSPRNEAQIARAIFARTILGDYGKNVDVIITPSVLDSIAAYTKAHGPGLAAASTAALVVGALFTPNVAVAVEPTPQIIQSSPSASHSGEITITIAPSAEVPNAQHQSSIPSETPEVQPTISVNTGVGSPTETNPRTHQSIVQIPAPIAAPETMISVAPSVNQLVESTPRIIPIAPEVSNNKPEAGQLITVAPPIELPAPLPPAESSPAPDGGTPTSGALPSSPEVSPNPSTPNQVPLTPEQLNAFSIRDTLYSDGKITNAVDAIVKKFGTNKDAKSDAMIDVSATVNPDFAASIGTLADSYKALIEASGHSDVNYINTSLMTLAVLEAAAKDPAVLQSKEIVALLDAVQVPTDPYQAKEYAKFLDTATKMLSDNNNALLTGIDTAVFQIQIEKWYAYALMADTTDVAQSADIQSMKDADAKAAAEAAAKAAADAAAKSQEQGGNSQSAEVEAITNLINNETDPVKKTMFKAFQFFIVNGYTAPQAAGIIGNLHRESGSTMDPGIHQDGGPAEGLAQWEGGRLTSLKEFAVSIGKPWDDLDTQLLFLVKEMDTTRHSAFGPVKSAQNIQDAAYAFLKYFETPYVVIHGSQAQINNEAVLRAARGQATLDAFTAELKVITDARNVAEAERQAKKANGMNLADAVAFMDRYKNNPDNVNYIGGAGQSCNGGPLSNCVSLSVYFTNYFTTAVGMGKGTLPGDGGMVVNTILRRNPTIAGGKTAMIKRQVQNAATRALFLV
jgi:hypothetical protein